ncbi:P-loop containing nucleoside triphosphate hydrolase protein, partial [Melanomma pulvis-pyrius CBS 109.77]
PIRPLCTIDLDEIIKNDLVKDVEEFVGPRRTQWYANRGIPYRRGYLFHGPPGSGKTSTSTALAGHLKTNLFITSISEIRDDQHLRLIFQYPDAGDIVLLEDIDSAGIIREDMSGKSEQKAKKKKGVTLSGLLNVIDGTCGTSGVILIMTSNNPESLDKALVRPGRIDKQVYFGPVSQHVAKSIFMRMYQDETHNTENSTNKLIAELAHSFAENIPDYEITPAEVQGFLIR